MEKNHIEQRIEGLEFKMRDQWYTLKQGFTPANLIRDSLSTYMTRRTGQNPNNDSLLRTAITYGVSFLVAKFAQKTGTKFGKLFSRKELSN